MAIGKDDDAALLAWCDAFDKDIAAWPNHYLTDRLAKSVALLRALATRPAQAGAVAVIENWQERVSRPWRIDESGRAVEVPIPQPPPEAVPALPTSVLVEADDWEAASFAFGGPATGESESYNDCTLWVGEIEQDDGSKLYGLHVSCNECPEEGSITLATLPNPPPPPSGQGVGEFKNFHRSLCARFNYTHDEQFWWRDLVSLEEHIAAQHRPASAVSEDAVAYWLPVKHDRNVTIEDRYPPIWTIQTPNGIAYETDAGNVRHWHSIEAARKFADKLNKAEALSAAGVGTQA